MLNYCKYLYHKCTACFAAVFAFCLTASPSLAEDIIFDIDIIKNRGFDPKIGEQFRNGARFPEGRSEVSLKLNGLPRGRVMAEFNTRGELCITQQFINEAGLSTSAFLLHEDRCTLLTELWPQAELSAEPETNSLILALPETAISDVTNYNDWEHGGFGGVLNYNAQHLRSQTQGSRFSFSQLSTEVGFNFNDWVVRSNQSWSMSDSDDLRFRHQNVWAERTLYNIKSRLKAGRFIPTGNGLGVGRILGLQLTPESALYKSTRRVLVNVRDISGNYVSSRMGVSDAKDNFITVTGENGTVFIPDARPEMTLFVEQSDGKRCQFSLSELPVQPDAENKLYETMETVCRVQE